jgi:hypothetical protein
MADNAFELKKEIKKKKKKKTFRNMLCGKIKDSLSMFRSLFIFLMKMIFHSLNLC